MNEGIPYFPFDVHLDDDFELIEAEFGLTGFAVIVKLYQKIYGLGYYCEWTKDVALLFGKKIGFSKGDNVVSEIVSAAINRGIFDKALYEKYQILTSRGIQKRYFEAVSRRKNVIAKKQYLLVEVAQNFNNVNILSENANISFENVDISKQSKVKKSKVKKSKEESTAHTSVTPTKEPKHKYGEYKHVLLTDTQLSKLQAEYSNYEDLITFLDEGIEMKGYKYKNHYLAIRKWVVDAVRERNAKKPVGFNPNTDNFDHDELAKIARDKLGDF